MNPAIITDPDNPRLRWLVDLDSRNRLYEKNTQQHVVHYETALNIMELEPGDYQMHLKQPNLEDQLNGAYIMPFGEEAANHFSAGYAHPSPCVYAKLANHLVDDGWSVGKVNRIGLIHLKAAKALLLLASSYNQVVSDRITGEFKFGGARTERPEALPNSVEFRAWDVWKFHTAWKWSEWENRNGKVTLEQRFNEIKAGGYPHKLSAFENMHRKLFKNL